MPHPGKDLLLLNQPGTLPDRTGEGGLECAGERVYVVRRFDSTKVFAPERFEPVRGRPPRIDEGTELVLIIARHMKS